MAADFEPSPDKPVEDRLDELASESTDTPTSLPVEADPADVVEQNIEVPIDDEYDR